MESHSHSRMSIGDALLIIIEHFQTPALMLQEVPIFKAVTKEDHAGQLWSGIWRLVIFEIDDGLVALPQCCYFEALRQCIKKETRGERMH